MTGFSLTPFLTGGRLADLVVHALDFGCLRKQLSIFNNKASDDSE